MGNLNGDFPDLATALDELGDKGDEYGRGRVLLAAAAYPDGDDGLPAEARDGSRDGPAARFCEAMLDWRMHQAPLAIVRKQLGYKVKRRKYESWIGIYEQGLANLKAAEAAFWARMTANFYGTSLSRVMDKLPKTLTANLAIYAGRDGETPQYDFEYMAKRIRVYDPVMHLIAALRGEASKRVRGPNLGWIAAAAPSLLLDFEGWPASVVGDAETFRFMQAQQMGFASERMIPLTKKAAQIT